MILLIDNYDSFSYNLYQYIGSIYPEIRVVRNDALTLKEIRQMKPEAIVLSPGPGRRRTPGFVRTWSEVWGRRFRFWNLPGPSGHLPGLRGPDHLRQRADARENLPGDVGRFPNL